jgi:hypothetical protein
MGEWAPLPSPRHSPATALERVRFHRLRRGGAAAAGAARHSIRGVWLYLETEVTRLDQGQWLSYSGHGATPTARGQYRSRRPENFSYPKNTLLGRAGQTADPKLGRLGLTGARNVNG